MNLSLIIIGLAAMAIFIVPIAYIMGAGKRMDKNKLKGFKKLAEQNGILISKYDLWNDNCIGVDLNAKKVFVLNVLNQQSVYKTINLSDFVSCRVINDSKTIKTKHNKSTLVERIALAFKPSNMDSSETEVVFFDKNNNATLNNEYQLAEDWAKQLNEILVRSY